MRCRGTPLAPLSPEVRQRPILGQKAQAISMKNALVPLTPQAHGPASAQSDRRATPDHANSDRANSNRAKADFVAHLIATAVQVPQTRARRRADPVDVLAAYRALGQSPSQPGRALSRSL